MKNKKKIIKYSIITIIVIIFVIIGYMVYKNVFAGSESKRFENIENYKLTTEEINSVKDKLNEIENIEDVNIYTNSKIIKIHIVLSEDTDFKKIKDISNDSLSKFSDDNLSFYDIEIFIESKNEDSSDYPQIGYKHKTNSKFSW